MEMALEKLVTLYQKAEMGLISAMSGTTSTVINEALFFDSGYIQTMVERNQKEYKALVDDLKVQLEVKDDTPEWKERTARLMERRGEVFRRMIFLSSNIQTNLEKCAELCKGEDMDFSRCIDALLAYKRGDKAAALEIFEDYCRESGRVENHFLANKIYGALLAERGEYERAAELLTYALQFVPDELDTLKCLEMCYVRMDKPREAAVVGEILMVLGVEQ